MWRKPQPQSFVTTAFRAVVVEGRATLLSHVVKKVENNILQPFLYFTICFCNTHSVRRGYVSTSQCSNVVESTQSWKVHHPRTSANLDSPAGTERPRPAAPPAGYQENPRPVESSEAGVHWGRVRVVYWASAISTSPRTSPQGESSGTS